MSDIQMYNAVMDLPKAYYLQTVESVFQRFDLARGVWDVRGERVDPGQIKKTALMTLEGELDDISGAGQTHSAQELCGSIAEELRERWTVPGVGHYGVFSGSKFKALVAPRINAFIQRREGLEERLGSKLRRATSTLFKRPLGAFWFWAAFIVSLERPKAALMRLRAKPTAQGARLRQSRLGGEK